MKKFALLLIGLVVAAYAIAAVPEQIKKDIPKIEKAIKMNFEKVSKFIILADQAKWDRRQQSLYTLQFEMQAIPETEMQLMRPLDMRWQPSHFVNIKNSLTKKAILQQRFLARKIPLNS